MYHSRFTGSHYSAGLRYGMELREKGLQPVAGTEPDRSRMDFAGACMPVYERFYPEILEEIQGMADGLGIGIMDIAGFLFPMYCYAYGQKCSCFACSDGGTILLGKNSDFSVNIEKLCDSVYYRLEQGYSFIGNTTAWTEIEDGVNEYGLAAGLTFIYPVKIAPGFNSGMLLRYLLEKCRTVNEALDSLQKIPIASAQTFTLADRSGAIALAECNCDKISVQRPLEGKPFVFAANHFVSEEMKEYQYTGIDDCHSHERYHVMEKAFADRRKYDTDFAKDLLSGKKGFMCQYDRRQGMDTVWSSIYDLAEGRIYRAEGNPSRQGYMRDERMRIHRDSP